MPEGLEPRELDLRDYLRVLRRRRGTIALVVILVVGAAVAYSLYQNKVYEATAQVLVRTANAQTPGSTDQATEILLMEAPAVRGAATKKLDHVPDVSVSQIGTSSVVAVTARSSHPKQAARDATVYARTYIDVRRKQTLTELLASTNDIQTKIQQLDAQSEQLDQALAAAVDPTERTALVTSQSSQRNNLASQRAAYSAQLNQLQASVSAAGASRQLVAVASVPTSPVEPKPLRNALIALVVGLVLGILAAFVREYFHDTVMTKEDVERVSGKLRVLGLIPAVKGWRNRKKAVLVSATAPNSRAPRRPTAPCGRRCSSSRSSGRSGRSRSRVRARSTARRRRSPTSPSPRRAPGGSWSSSAATCVAPGCTSSSGSPTTWGSPRCCSVRCRSSTRCRPSTASPACWCSRRVRRRRTRPSCSRPHGRRRSWARCGSGATS